MNLVDEWKRGAALFIALEWMCCSKDDNKPNLACGSIHVRHVCHRSLWVILQTSSRRLCEYLLLSTLRCFFRRSTKICYSGAFEQKIGILYQSLKFYKAIIFLWDCQSFISRTINIRRHFGRKAILAIPRFYAVHNVVKCFWVMTG